MELKRRLDPKIILIGLYVVFLIIYVAIGLRPAEATKYEIDSKLDIPSIGLMSDVTRLTLTGGKLESPNEIVGSYSTSNNKILLIGHSTTVFQNLNQIELNDTIYYDHQNYKVTNIEVKEKSAIHMGEILNAEDNKTIVLMTCAGTLFQNGDATHRLIITAVSE